MSIAPSAVIDELLAAARSKGLDQAGLARAAGVAAETISRAKKRGNIEWRTLTALAAAAGVRLRVEAAGAPPERAAADRSPLADPRWGLAWSNPHASARVLVTNALLRGSFDVILEATAQHGLDFVRGQWNRLKRQRPRPVSKRTIASVERILRNIAEGFGRAEG